MRYEGIVARLLMATIGLIVSGRAVSGQLRGVQNEALLSASVNAAALERPSRLSLAVGGYGSSTEEWLLGAGVGIGRGALYALANRRYRQRQRGFNVGYAQLLGAQSFTPSLGASVGVDLSGGLLRYAGTPSATAYATRISVPLALQWGAPTRASLTGYIAPYGEIGRSPRFDYSCSETFSIWSCTLVGVRSAGTSAFGAGAGLRLTAWRFGLDFGVREVLNHPIGSGRNPASAMLTFRF